MRRLPRLNMRTAVVKQTVEIRCHNTNVAAGSGCEVDECLVCGKVRRVVRLQRGRHGGLYILH